MEQKKDNVTAPPLSNPRELTSISYFLGKRGKKRSREGKKVRAPPHLAREERRCSGIYGHRESNCATFKRLKKEATRPFHEGDCVTFPGRSLGQEEADVGRRKKEAATEKKHTDKTTKPLDLKKTR